MISSLLYLFSAFLMVIAIDSLSSPSRVVKGYHIAIVSVGIALLTCMTINIQYNALWIVLTLLAGGGIGVIFALRVQLSKLPQMVALLNGVGGLALSLIHISEPPNCTVGCTKILIGSNGSAWGLKFYCWQMPDILYRPITVSEE